MFITLNMPGWLLEEVSWNIRGGPRGSNGGRGDQSLEHNNLHVQRLCWNATCWGFLVGRAALCAIFVGFSKTSG